MKLGLSPEDEMRYIKLVSRVLYIDRPYEDGKAIPISGNTDTISEKYVREMIEGLKKTLKKLI